MLNGSLVAKENGWKPLHEKATAAKGDDGAIVAANAWIFQNLFKGVMDVMARILLLAFAYKWSSASRESSFLPGCRHQRDGDTRKVSVHLSTTSY